VTATSLPQRLRASFFVGPTWLLDRPRRVLSLHVLKSTSIRWRGLSVLRRPQDGSRFDEIHFSDNPFSTSAFGNEGVAVRS
jgi:hypothetical protein